MKGQNQTRSRGGVSHGGVMSVSRGEGRSRHGGVGAARQRQIASWWSCYHLAVAVWSWYWVEAREGL